MRIIKNNHHPRLIKQYCDHCGSHIELDIDKDLNPIYKNEGNQQYIEKYWICPCCNKWNNISKFMKKMFVKEDKIKW